MPSARIRSLEFLADESQLDPASGSVDLQAELEDGRRSAFVTATADQPGRWVGDGDGFSFGTPVLFIQRLDKQSVGEAAQAMAAEMGGYWLRYYNSADDLSRVGRTLKLTATKRRAPRR